MSRGSAGVSSQMMEFSTSTVGPCASTPAPLPLSMSGDMLTSTISSASALWDLSWITDTHLTPVIDCSSRTELATNTSIGFRWGLRAFSTEKCPMSKSSATAS